MSCQSARPFIFIQEPLDMEKPINKYYFKCCTVISTFLFSNSGRGDVQFHTFRKYKNIFDNEMDKMAQKM